jgi:hypothetical protein
MTEHLDIAVRAYTEAAPSEERAKRPRVRQPKDWRPKYVLVFDTETTTDRTQRLLLGCYRFCQVTWRATGPQLECLEEGLLYADELPQTDPHGFEVLRDYVRSHRPATDPGLPGWRTSIHLRLMSRREFAERFDKAARRARATVVGFNLPFDLSRIAVSCGAARGRFAGGFSLGLAEYQDHDGVWRANPHRPAIAIKTIDPKRSLIGLTAPLGADSVDLIPDGATNGKPKRGSPFRGHFLDLRTLAFALTDRGHTLESACATFNAPYTKRAVEHGHITTHYITYCREDVEATAGLYVAAMGEYVRHPIQLQPTKAYSPASIGKAYLKEMGVRPPLDRQPGFPRDVLGYAMVAYYGGRSECRIRRVPVPVVYCDFLAMYSTVCALLGLWRLLTSTKVRVVEHDPAQLQAQLGNLTPDQLLEPSRWPGLVALAQIAPDGDVLPVRGRYDGKNFGIGLNPLHTTEPMWYALPDLHAATLLTGRAPTILRHIAFAPGRRVRALRPVRLRGQVEIDPSRDDFIKALVEQRKTLAHQTGISRAELERLDQFLKVLGNSTNYGIYAEMNRNEQPGNQRTDIAVYGLDQFPTKTATPEQAGGYFFSPYACVIASGARMMLALLERLVTNQGGTYAFGDTDSMAIVSTRTGGLVACPGGPHLLDGQPAIRALSWEQTDHIVEQFERLNPYDWEAIPGSILEIEKENHDPATGERRQLHCQAISAKRYDLYNLDAHGTATIRKHVHDGTDEPETEDSDSESVAVDALRKRSEHGLGHLLNPTDPDDESRDWITHAWQDKTQRLLGLDTGPERDWLDRPALTRTTISTPRLQRAFADLNDKRPYADQVKPFQLPARRPRRATRPPRWRRPRPVPPRRPVQPRPTAMEEAPLDQPLPTRQQLPHHHHRPTLRPHRPRQDVPRHPHRIPHPPRTQEPRTQRHPLRPRHHRTTPTPARSRHHHHPHRQRSQPPRRPSSRPRPRPMRDSQRIRQSCTRPVRPGRAPRATRMPRCRDRHGHRPQPTNHQASTHRDGLTNRSDPRSVDRLRCQVRANQTALGWQLAATRC